MTGRLVADASVAANWVLPEPHSDTARHLPTRRTMLAPDLLWAKLGRVLRLRQRRGELTVLDTRDMLAELALLSHSGVSAFAPLAGRSRPGHGD